LKIDNLPLSLIFNMYRPDSVVKGYITAMDRKTTL